MKLVLSYTVTGHFNGMAHAMEDRFQIDRDNHGFPAYFNTKEEVLSRFENILDLSRVQIRQNAILSNERNPSKSVDEYEKGILNIHPLPHSPKATYLVEMND